MSETQVVLARLMLAEGVTREIIAQALRVSRSTLLNYLKPYGTGSHPKMRRANQEPSSGRGS
jgi:ParB-like chromosome segregation protein Spo0J